MTLIQFVIGLVAYWTTISLAGYYLVTKAFRRHRKQPQFAVPQHYQGFKRQDFGKWNESQIKKGCFLRLPIKAPILLCYVLGFATLSVIKKYLFVPDKCIDFWRNYVGRLANKTVFDLEEHFDINQIVDTPMVIANHVGWFDFNYIGSCFRLFSFVAKVEIKQVFGLNAITEYGHCLYVDRTAANGATRGNIFVQIKHRIQQFLACKDGSVKPIMMFPQGTVSNGRTVMSFKNGAFQNLPPITIFSLRYQCKDFHMGMDEINAFYYTVIALCLNPKLIVKKQVVHANAGQSVKTIGEMGGLKLLDCSYKDIVEYEAMKKKLRKQMAK